jgi:glycosyltransferase involved in cell wall biosynthesis
VLLAPGAVTVVITCYNYGSFVGEAIDSCLAQSRPPDSIVVIDDASTDDSWAAISRYPGVRSIRLNRNVGVVGARNAGLAEVHTEWVVFLDADDVLPPEYLDQLLEVAAEGDADVVYPGAIWTYRDGRVRPHPPREFDMRDLGTFNFVHASALVRTSVIIEAGGFAHEMKWGYEDWELWIRLLDRGAVFRPHEGTSLYYRQHGQGRNLTARRRHRDLLSLMWSRYPHRFDRRHRIRARVLIAIEPFRAAGHRFANRSIARR